MENTIPEAPISRHPITITVLRPILSENHVKKYEMNVSPINVKVMKIPILSFEMPADSRKSVSTWFVSPKLALLSNTDANSSLTSKEVGIINANENGNQNENKIK